MNRSVSRERAEVCVFLLFESGPPSSWLFFLSGPSDTTVFTSLSYVAMRGLVFRQLLVM